MRLILGLLVLYIFADSLGVAAHAIDKIPARPQALTCVISLSLEDMPGDVNRALSLDVANHARHRVLRRYAHEHVYVIGHYVPL